MRASMMRRRRVLAGGVAVLGLRVAPARAQAAAVAVNFHAFAPAMLRVAVGTTVTWTNEDDTPHNIVSTADPRAFRSAALDTGESFAFRFAAPGTYGYYCSLHPTMQGSIVVG
jgi:plastocyanin